MSGFTPILLIAITMSLVLFQNCSPGHKGERSFDLSSYGSINSAAKAIVEDRCSFCHSPGLGYDGPTDTSDPALLVSEGYIVPGSPDSSTFFHSIATNSMPLGAPLNEEEKDVLEQWIVSWGQNPDGSGGGSITDPNGFNCSTPRTYTQVRTILDNSCMECHDGSDGNRGRPNFSDYELLMESGYIVPSDPYTSLLHYNVLFGIMPKNRDPLPQEDVETIHCWIAGGALQD